MMITPVLFKKYDDIPVNINEVLRYAGAKNVDGALKGLIDGCINECSCRFIYKVCYREFDITVDGDTVGMPFLEVHSRDLANNLRGCKNAVLFAATVGFEIDRLITRYSKVSPSRSVIFQAIGAERIESLCDTFCSEIEMTGAQLKPRFSPGYGDFALENQKIIMDVLDASRKIGVSLNDSMLMSPSKSVTAIIGRIK